MKAQTKKLLTYLGIGAAVAGVWYFTKPDADAATIPTPPAPGPAYIPPAGPTPPAGPGPTTVYPVIGGIQAKVGDNLYASGTSAGIYKTANVASKVMDQYFPVGNKVGKVIDTSPNGFLKVQLYTGAPVWDNAPHYEFFVSKYNLYIVRP